MSIIQRLQVLADDLPLTMHIAQLLKKLEMKVHVIEPHDNPEFAEQDIEALKKSGELYEVVQAYLQHLVVTIYITSDNGLAAEIAAYRRYLFKQDNFAALLLQLKSNKPLKLNFLLNLIKQLLPLAEDCQTLINKMLELNKKLHWFKSVRVQQKKPETTTAADNLIHLDKQHHGHVTPVFSSEGHRIKARCMGPRRCPTCQQEWRDKYGTDYPNKSTVVADDSQQIAQTILNQLGSQKFLSMTGAKNLVRLKNGLQFDLPGRMTKNHINKVAITLENDEYTIITYKLRGVDLRPVDTKNGIQASQLKQIFSQLTGLETHL
jgi:hypothetical protein